MSPAAKSPCAAGRGTLKEELFYDAPTPLPPAPSRATTLAPDLLEMTITAGQAHLTGLHTQHRQLHQYVEQLAQTARVHPADQDTIAALRRTVQTMATALATAQETHQRLTRTLHDR